METVKISPKFRVVIPKRARETFNPKAGEELEVCIVDGSIHLRRPPKIRRLRGQGHEMEGRLTEITPIGSKVVKLLMP